MARKSGSRDKLRTYFLEHVGQIIESDTLKAASGNVSEWARRVRELRNEEGYQILTHNDRSDLKPGQYILIDPIPEPRRKRNISKETRALVLDRDGFTCQMCGAVAGEPHPEDSTRTTRLHIGHIIDFSQGGSDDPANLRTLCSICNEGAANITPPRPLADKLLAQIRRAPRSEQLKILQWLVKKFPNETKNFLE